MNIGKNEFDWPFETLQTGTLPDLEMRALTAEEVAQLESQGNLCSDWSVVSIENDCDLARVVGNHFLGPVRIARQTETISARIRDGEDSVTVTPGRDSPSRSLTVPFRNPI